MGKLYNKLYKKAFIDNYDNVLHFSYSYLKDFKLAEDITQESFVQLWKNREKVDFSKSVLPYLIVISKNLSLSALRKDKNFRNYSDYTKNQTKEYLNYSALKDVSASKLYTHEVELIIKKTIEKLPVKIQETFTLSRINNKSYKEIADIQQVSIKTVEGRITYALKTLREVLKDYLVIIIGFVGL